MTDFVPLQLLPHPNGVIQAVVEDLPDAWSALRDSALAEGAVRVVDSPYKGSRGVRAKKPLPAILPTGDWLRVPVVTNKLARLFDGVDGVTLRPTTLWDAKGKLAAGYVIVEIGAIVPLDRAASDATWSRGWLDELQVARWKVAPRVRAFRLLDRPHLLFVDAELDAALREAAPKQLALDDAEEAGAPELFPPSWSLPRVPALPDGKAAERAFWALYAGDRKARAAAVAHPWWALAVAACVDRAPRTDTRAGACAHPLTAARYAAEVDQGAHATTRSAAIRHGLGAVLYATHVELEIAAAARPAILKQAGHDEETLATLEGSLAILRAWSRGEEVEQAPRVAVARRTWPAHDRPRYAALEGKKRSGSCHSPLDAELCSDIDAFVGRGYRRLGLDAAPIPEAVIDALLAYVESVQTGEVKLAGKARTTAQMELGCAWGEQLHRTLGWQWARVHWADGEAIALISPDRAHVHFPFSFVGEQASRRATRNTCALLFNMLADGDLPAARRGEYLSIA